MIVKNTLNKDLVFGSTIIKGKKTGELQAPFDDEHPTIKSFLSKGWLKKSELEPHSPDLPEIQPGQPEQLLEESQSDPESAKQKVKSGKSKNDNE